MTPDDARAWRPTLPGWSDDILPFYERMAPTLAPGAQVAEIGVAWGRSILFLAEQLGKLGNPALLWAIDSWEASWDYPAEVTPRAAWRFPRAPMVKTLVDHASAAELNLVRLVRASSRQAARLFAYPCLDLAFLDGDHSYAAVVEDVVAWEPLVRVGGTLAGHDYDRARFPDVCNVVDSFVGTRGDAFGPLVVEGSVWSVRKR